MSDNDKYLDGAVQEFEDKATSAIKHMRHAIKEHRKYYEDEQGEDERGNEDAVIEVLSYLVKQVTFFEFLVEKFLELIEATDLPRY